MSNLSKFASKARTHEEARAVVCCVCGRKVVARKGGFPCVSDRLANLVSKYVYENFSVQNSYHPTAICGTCRVTLGAFEKVNIAINCHLFWSVNKYKHLFQNPNQSKYRFPPFLNYDNLAPPAPKTRATVSDSCNCQICSIARKTLDYSAFAALHSRKVGAPSTNPKSPPSKTLAVCSKCWGEIGKGKTHNCQKTTKRDNISNIVKNTSGKSRANVASRTLKTIAEEQDVSLRGGVVQLQSGSKTLPVQIGKPTVKPKEPKFSHENLKKLQAAHNLSDKAVL